MNYIGERCGWCGTELLPDDDIVVCPVCGTPHHRACYAEHQACANQARHDEGFVWEPTLQQETSSMVCGRCHKANPDGSRFCIYCGSPLSPESGVPTAPASVFERPSVEDVGDWTVDGFSAADWAVMISVNRRYYLTALKRMDETNGKVFFCWYPMLFPGIYYLYRRAWRTAAVSLLIELLLFFPMICVSFLIPSGVALPFTAAVWANIATVSQGLTLLFRAFFALFGVWIWRKSAVKRMTKLRESCPDEEAFRERLPSISGPSYRAAMFILGGAASLLFLAFLFLSLL